MWTYLVHITGLWISSSSDPSITRNSSLPCRVANWSQFAQDLPGFNSESPTFRETLILGKLATQIPIVDLGIRSPLIFFERCKWWLELHIITFWLLEYVSLDVTQGKDSHVKKRFIWVTVFTITLHWMLPYFNSCPFILQNPVHLPPHTWLLPWTL